jgi:hypothetical protein
VIALRPIRLPPVLTRILRNLATQDFCCLGYHTYMLLRMALAPRQALAHAALPELWVLLGVTALTLVAVRGELLPPGRGRALVYRLGMMVPIVLAYLPLRYALSALDQPLLDGALCHLDELALGQTPAVYFERFVTPRRVEWFAFFYYSYFTLAFLHFVGPALLDRGRRAAEILFAGMLVSCLGHTLYTLVPGAGPYAALHFARPLAGGLFFHLVSTAVATAGAKLDIFPSLHTAYPTLFLLHSLRYRHHPVYRCTLVPTAFFTVNIILATLFLRWHYAIDVLAGLVLAACAQRLGMLCATHEDDAVRQSEHRQLVWESLR